MGERRSGKKPETEPPSEAASATPPSLEPASPGPTSTEPPPPEPPCVTARCGEPQPSPGRPTRKTSSGKPRCTHSPRTRERKRARKRPIAAGVAPGAPRRKEPLRQGKAALDVGEIDDHVLHRRWSPACPCPLRRPEDPKPLLRPP